MEKVREEGKTMIATTTTPLPSFFHRETVLSSFFPSFLPSVRPD